MNRYKNILLVEDDLDDQLFFAEAITDIEPPASLLIAKDGKHALELLRFSIPDIIFLDLHTPGMTGFEFLIALRAEAKYKSIPVIVLSTTTFRKAECYKLGAITFIEK